jgi:NAD-dependent dihydropyrimidine dehydrogenase PreA subunit
VSQEEIYTRFIHWLRQTWWGLPEGDELLPLIKARYAPEEAALLTGMPFSGRNLEELAEMKGMEPAELDAQLHAMARKGLVFRSRRGETVRYSLNDSFFVFYRSSFWSGDIDEASKSIAPLVNQYHLHGFMDQYAGVQTKGLRTIPIEKTIEDPRRILPYEDVVKVLDAQEYFSVSICPCRHRKNLDADSPDCTYPTEVCLHFGRLGHYIVEHGMGREITRGETREILQVAAESGLVHAVSNWQQGVDTICNCCKCCCLFLEAFHVLKHSKSLDASNYRVGTNPDTCKGCGLCVERCPMEALRLEDSTETPNERGKVAVLDPLLCIGCGVCAYTCPAQSLVLERREVIVDPPEDARGYLKRFMAERRAEFHVHKGGETG